MVDAEARVEVLERTSALALWSDGERCHGVIADSRPDRLGGDRARDRRRRRALAADDQPLGRDRRRAGARRGGRRRPRRPRVLPVPPDRPLAARHPVRRPADHRGGARRGRDPARRLRASASPTSWRRATRSPPRSSPGSRPTAATAVKLDLRGLDPARFPNVFASLAEAGLDAAAEPVPVAPAAHYMMGGVAVDLDGRSSLPGLFAVGECSCTGLHGANRLASNSLSECFVFGGRAAAAALRESAAGKRARARLPGASSRRPRRPATRSGASPARSATPTGLERLLDRPLPAGRGDRRPAPCERRGVPRRPPALRLPRHRPRARRHPHRARAGRRHATRDLGLSAEFG